MKKIFNAIIVLMSISSCSMSDRYWGSYDPEAYMYIDENVTKECMNRAIVTLEYVRMAYEKEDIRPVDGASYVITDESGYKKIGPLVCSISGADTVWSYSNYAVQRISMEKGEWKVSRHDDVDKYGFRYDFVLNVQEGVAEDDETFVPLTVSLEGARYENSAYHVTFKTEGPFVIQSGFSMRGTIKYLFFEREKQRDWMTSTFLENGSICYESSF